MAALPAARPGGPYHDHDGFPILARDMDMAINSPTWKLARDLFAAQALCAAPRRAPVFLWGHRRPGSAPAGSTLRRAAAQQPASWQRFRSPRVLLGRPAGPNLDLGLRQQENPTENPSRTAMEALAAGLFDSSREWKLLWASPCRDLLGTAVICSA